MPVPDAKVAALRQRLDTYRSDRRLTWAELAAAIDAAVPTINGRRRVSVETLIRFVRNGRTVSLDTYRACEQFLERSEARAAEATA
jgi:hypothetical protein